MNALKIHGFTKNLKQFTLFIQVKELEESKLAKKVKTLEEEKKENDTSVKLLESQRNALLDSLERVQKILQGFESVIKDKNEQIQESSTKLEESENPTKI